MNHRTITELYHYINEDRFEAVALCLTEVL
jgi:hypothetical protein